MNAPRARVARRPVHGVLLLDKPLGLSSNDALQKAKWLLRAEKAGHTGTLDPLASGLLPLCFGAATKFSQLHLDANKTYEAVAQLGITTTTGDSEGDVVTRRDVPVIDAAMLTKVQDAFTGAQRQVPPMYSALKKDGKALYEYAREGIEIDRPARDITVFALNLELIDGLAGVPAVKIRVTCSKGTYIRTLGEDIGEAIGCGAHLTFLRRVATGPFDQAECITLETLAEMPESERMELLKPVACLLADHEIVELDSDNAGRFLSGLRRRGSWPDNERVAVFGKSPSTLLGAAHVTAGELIPDRLLSPIEIAQILENTPNREVAGIEENL